MPVWVVHVKEKQPTSSTDAIEWFLMTNDPINDLNEAYDQVKYYQHRWKIERFHYTLKSGCKVEKIQARTMEVTLKLIMMYSIISVFIMNITYLARIKPDLTCELFFYEDEWKLLYCLATKSNDIPQTPYTLKEAVKYLACVGGPKMAKSDGDPGLKAIWKGLERFYLLYENRKIIYNFVGQV